mmetsp:Transcript_16200/g.29063  ORF Transcript_16200/g.29063 Transcript_16200/m.29063 type:complete len:234 (-) Transcript_16200:146-847(-)
MMSSTPRKMIPSLFALVLLALVCCLPSTECFQPRQGHGNRHFRTSKPHDYANLPSVEDEAPPVASSSFRQRMLVRIQKEDLRKRRTQGAHTSPKSSSSSPPLIQDVRTMEEFKTALDENHPLMVAMWYSPWCLACRSVVPGMRALAKHHPNIKFIQIPVLEENANLHQGLQVPSVPFVHLYLPDSHLAEEGKLSRRKMSAFHRMLHDYEMGRCSLERVGLEEEEWSTSCPYSL